ncbi:FHA domain-containing protein [Kribbella qitaiheensis]|uniref:FHA domain-containing protein n=1 Tax=Kribbella qitaiheensis TaxID=1544730 RepID=UPI00360F46C3
MTASVPQPIRNAEQLRAGSVPGLEAPPGGATVLIELDGSPVSVTATVFVLGRQPGPDSPLADRLANYPNVSRRHARITVVGDHFQVEDDSSLNNTFVNGVPIKGEGPHPLESRGILRLARNCHLTLTVAQLPGKPIVQGFA